MAPPGPESLRKALLGDEDADERLSAPPAGPSGRPPYVRRSAAAADEEDAPPQLPEADDDEPEYVPVKKRRLMEAMDREKRLGMNLLRGQEELQAKEAANKALEERPPARAAVVRVPASRLRLPPLRPRANAHAHTTHLAPPVRAPLLRAACRAPAGDRPGREPGSTVAFPRRPRPSGAREPPDEEG